MEYRNIHRGRFVDRPNRFVAHVEIDGAVETVHVKNTGRCRELLLPGIPVLLEKSENPDRKTAYDLVTVWKEGIGWINMDSQAPNRLAAEWLAEQGYDRVKPEYTYGSSRIDFTMEKGGERYLMEVKGCTLEVDRIGYFPDAPTLRGAKHLRELAKAAGEGWHAILCFVIQMPGVREVRPNAGTDPDFAAVYEEALRAGVEIISLCCDVSETEVRVTGMVQKEKIAPEPDL